MLAATSSIAGITCRAWNSSGTFFHNDMQAHTHTHTHKQTHTHTTHTNKHTYTHMLFFFFIIGVWCLLLLT